MSIEWQRRTLLKLMAAGATSYALPSLSLASPAAKFGPDLGDPWAYADTIRDSIVEPVIPDRDFLLQDYGGAGDGATDNTAAFKRAIAACAKAGGGRVIVKGGVFKTGPIHLKSNVNLRVEKDATVSFIPEPERYLPPVFTRWEGMEFMGYSPLIYAFGEQNIAITGEGTLDGNADPEHWWPWKGPWKQHREWGADGAPTQKAGRAKLFADAEKGVPPEKRVYAEGAYLRPPFIQPYRCRNVLIEGVTIIRSPFWLINPVLCENVTVRKALCRSMGPNSDGCDPESCRNVIIEDCFFDTGDDCIAIKSGRNADGRRINVPSENIVISGCKMRAGHGGVVIGSEISGGARNIFVENCEMSSPDLERGIRIKTNSHRGGTIENYFIRNVRIGNVKDAIVINFYYEEGDTGKFDPVLRNVEISNLTCAHAERAFYIRGFERSPIRGLTLKNLRFDKVEEPGVIEHVKDLRLDNVMIEGKPFEESRVRKTADVLLMEPAAAV
jgi:polygalacturonase